VIVPGGFSPARPPVDEANTLGFVLSHSVMSDLAGREVPQRHRNALWI
jgi:hypothetical protein